MAIFQHTTKALNSEIVLTIRHTDQKKTQSFFEKIVDQINAFEQRFSRFLPESELSLLNRSAGRKYGISPEMTAILTTSKKMGLETQGIYNPFVLPLLQQSGYRGAWPKTETVTTKLDFSDRAFHHIDQLQINGSTIQIPADSAIDLGGIGKGYLLDQIAKQAESSGFSDFWFSLGGDIIFIGYDENQKSWSIGIADATDEDRDIDKLETEGEKIAVATSGIIKRKGNDWHHLIDPRTGQPAETDILSATVIAISGVEADVFAKCLVIQGEKLAEKFIREHKILKAYIQTKNQHKPIILTGNNHG